MCSELIDGVVSEELGVPGVITPPLYRHMVWVKYICDQFNVDHSSVVS